MRSRHPGRGFPGHSLHQELQQSLPRSGLTLPFEALGRAALSAEAGDTAAVSSGNLIPSDSMHPGMAMTIKGLFTQPPSVGTVGPAHPPRA